MRDNIVEEGHRRFRGDFGAMVGLDERERDRICGGIGKGGLCMIGE
jgi:hypothetical protein